MASVLCSTGNTGVLCRGTSREFPSGVCDHGFLAVLGRASLGGRLFRAFHDRCCRLYVRSSWNGSYRYGAARYLPGHHSIFDGWRDRHDASPLFQRNSRGAHGFGRDIFGNGSDPPASTDARSLWIHEVWGPVDGRPDASASMGRLVPGGCWGLELLWRRRFRFLDQPSDCQLLRNRNQPHSESRTHSDDGRLWHARSRLASILSALFDSTGYVE